MLFDRQHALVLSRTYICLCTNYRCYLRSHNSKKTTLVFTIKHDKGELEFSLLDENKNLVFSLKNPSSDTYSVELEVNKKYLLIIKAKSASGSYKIVKEFQ